MYIKTTLGNGIRVLKIPNKNIDTVTALAIFCTGSRDEKGRMEGIAHFLEHMIFKGTEKRPKAIDISKELDGIGASYNAFTGKEYTGFYIKAEKKNLELALDMLSDILLHSKFESAEIENEKGAVIEEINMYEDAPMRNIPSVFENMLYEGQSLGHDQLGSKENVISFSRRNLLSFYRRHYRPDNLVIAISGNFNAPKTDTLVEKFFSAFEESDKVCRRIKNYDRQSCPEICLKYKRTDQSNLSLGFRTFPREHPDQYALEILSVILGGNSSSRLYERIREKEGLVYYIYTYTEDFYDAGYLTIQAGIGNDKCEKAVGLIMEEIRKIKTEEISEEEIALAKNHIRGRIAISLESSSTLASFIASQELLTGKILTPQDKFDKINAVTSEDLKRVAENVFMDNRMNLAIIGPFRNKKNFLKILNT